eukprot:EG_transcript_18717
MRCAAFNQDGSQFAQGGDKGFEVWGVEPTERLAECSVPGGVQLVQKHLRTNLFAVVGAGDHPGWPNHKVILWDQQHQEARGVLSFPAPVCAVRLTDDYIVVALETAVVVCNWTCERLHRVGTAANHRGVLAVSLTNSPLLAAPDASTGHVLVADLATGKRLGGVAAHQSALSAVALSADGRLLATTSDRGTLVRVWNARGGQMLHELRRGATQCTVYDMAFSPSRHCLALVSSHGTVHLFGIPAAVDAQNGRPPDSKPAAHEEDGGLKNRVSSLSGLWALPTYFSSQWSSSWFHLPIPLDRPAALSFVGEAAAPPRLLVVVPGRAALWLSVNPRKP